MNITVHIEHLVLDGLPLAAADSTAVQAAVQTELTRLLTDGGLAADLQHDGAFTSVRGTAVSMGRDTAPAQLGQQISAAVYGGIGR